LEPEWHLTPTHALLRIALGLFATLALVASASPAQAKKPEWVSRSGMSEEYPRERYITGFGVASGGNALEQATQAASADLARKISVRIESEVSDISQEQNGNYTYKLAAVTRSTTDVRVSHLRYEKYKKWGKVYVLAWIDRKEAARARRAERDRALAELRACFASAQLEMEADRKASALFTYETCRKPIAEALQHEAVASAVLVGGRRDPAVHEELVTASRRLDREIESMLTKSSTSLASAADAMALQLSRQGVSTERRIVVAHFNFGTTNLSSSFGRHAGLELERALASSARPVASTPGEETAPDLAMRGVYLVSDDQLRLSVTAREVVSGRLVASAEATMSVSAVPSHLELKPTNFEDALKSQRVLAEGGLVSGDLRLEVWTDKGRGGVLYTESEELKVYMRVNQSAWIRLIYVLQNGAQVPIDHGYFIDANKVNRVVEYPHTFEIVPPFGVEMIHATAFTEKPPRLMTTERLIDGQRYDVVADGLEAVVRTRGLARKHKQSLAEDILTVTTTPRF
jgi:hypothetical protein